MPDGTEAISDDELLYRRIPVSQEWYSLSHNPPLSPKAFRPRADDTHGLSLSRAKYHRIDEFGRARGERTFYVAVLRAGDLRDRGIQVVPDPIVDHPNLDDDRGHTLIPDMTYTSRKDDWCLEWQLALATELTLEVKGPFP